MTGASPALAITPASGLSPSDGATFNEADAIPFVVDGATDSEFVDVEISTQNVLGQNGTLADDFVVEELSLFASDAVPGRWTDEVFLDPGHYFWQAYGERSSPVFESNQPLGPILQFDVLPDLAMGKFHAQDDIIEFIRDHGPSRSRRFRFSNCQRIDATSWTCVTDWYSRRNLVYHGSASVQHVANGFELQVRGSFEGRSFKRGCVRREERRPGRLDLDRCPSKPYVIAPTLSD